MARTKGYKKYYRKSTSRYASNILDIGPSTFTLPNTENWNATDITLVTNPSFSTSDASSIKKIKNIELTMEAEASGTWEGIESIQYYIMYVPEDMTVNQDYPMKHPEYIMAYKFYGSPQPEYNDTIQLKQPVRIKSRLARNLNTGDKIILFLRAANTTTSSRSITYQGLIRWWTKSN